MIMIAILTCEGQHRRMKGHIYISLYIIINLELNVVHNIYTEKLREPDYFALGQEDIAVIDERMLNGIMSDRCLCEDIISDLKNNWNVLPCEIM